MLHEVFHFSHVKIMDFSYVWKKITYNQCCKVFITHQYMLVERQGELVCGCYVNLIICQFCSFYLCIGLFVSPSGISELDCATTKTDTAERSISTGRESLQFFFVLAALAYLQVPPLGGSRDEKWRSQ